MTGFLLRASVCVAVALLTAAWCAHAIGLAEVCGRYNSCGECHTSSADCGWCSTASSPTPHCVSLTAPTDRGVSCPPCEERSRTAREVDADTCDDSACLGVGSKPCSDHGACECGTCTCDPGYTGRVCQNCPSKWDDCPGTSFGTCCSNINQCLDWPSKCARCMRNEGNATLCELCPRDTRIVPSDPGVPQSAECVFDSLSFSSDQHCSYHVYYWRDEAALALHARVQLVCVSAADKTIFSKRNETGSGGRQGSGGHPAGGSRLHPSTAPPRALPEKAPEKAAEKAAETTERPEGAAKPPSAAAGAALCQATVILSCLWTLCGLR